MENRPLIKEGFRVIIEMPQEKLIELAQKAEHLLKNGMIL